ncbi:MAG TPA: UbiA family prenyltransferase [Fibrobacteria bacterium]|nr:UbiA family prenyltransferase [Fibrobacteria bacterium]
MNPLDENPSPVPATEPSSPRPLVVDLDGTLLRGDTLHEVVFSTLFSNPFKLVQAGFALLSGGKGRFKAVLSPSFAGDAASLPARQEVVDLAVQRKEQGGKVILATGANRSIAQAAAERFGFFDEVLATDGDDGNFVGSRKRDMLVGLHGAGGYDYVGDSLTDLPVWESAAEAYAVGSVARKGLRAGDKAVQALAPVEKPPRKWKVIRPHQWVKNFLLFLPLLSAHRLFETSSIFLAMLGFAAFSCAASLVYVVNDLADRASDRVHATKRRRPIAWGAVGPLHALAIAAILVVVLAGICIWIPWQATVAIGVYLVANLAYSFHFKRRLLVDVFLLAWMYVWRVVTGGLVTGITLTPWLLGFSGFTFLSLAFAKRYAEVVRLQGRKQGAAKGRAWRLDDAIPLLAAGIGCGVGGALVLALYVSGDSFASLYKNPTLAMLLSPLFLYWNLRLWIQAGRQELHEDPVVFAMKDKISYAVLGAAVAILGLAMI